MALRDDPAETLPALNVPFADDDDDTASIATLDPGQTSRGKWRQRAGRLRESIVGSASQSRDASSEGGGRPSMQDRLLNKLMAQILPDMPLDEEDEEDDEEPDTTPGSRKLAKKPKSHHAGRPELNMRAMATNFRLFNARIGVVFVFQDMMIQLFSWKQPTHTLAFLAVYTLICLKPHLIPVVPLAIALFAIMIPNFMARHRIPANDPRIGASFTGPPNAPASRIRPAPEVSRDFWRNMRDLQNSMGDFSTLHDAMSNSITPLVNFGDERLSSTLFLGCTILSCIALLGTWIVPYQLVALIGGWALVIIAHPEAQKVVLTTNNMSQAQQHLEALVAAFRIWVDADIIMDEPAESRQVEIFELQKHQPASDTWESWLFSPTPYEPLSAERAAAGSRPRGTQFFEDVAPPAGWAWKEKKWSLDLFSREWVEQRMITEVSIETEGERWVYDMPADEVPLLDSLTVSGSPQPATRVHRSKSAPRAGWEESTSLGAERHGAWRRRRWTRLVQKKPGDRKYIETEVSSPVSVP